MVKRSALDHPSSYPVSSRKARPGLGLTTSLLPTYKAGWRLHLLQRAAERAGLDRRGLYIGSPPVGCGDRWEVLRNRST